MIDLSDGISTDLLHICEESAVSAVVDEKLLPGHGASGWQREDMLHGGESYELLFTTPERTRLPARIAGVKITRIGEIVRRDGQKYRMMLVNAAGHSVKLEPRGWQHFKRNKH
jgi:thiamine-monophosphate kinase